VYVKAMRCGDWYHVASYVCSSNLSRHSQRWSMRSRVTGFCLQLPDLTFSVYTLFYRLQYMDNVRHCSAIHFRVQIFIVRLSSFFRYTVQLDQELATARNA
jgi:hypothetical protein